MEQEQSAYITSLHLKGYKSIRDVSVTLNKGLNILIGANGSGKTNFLEFLDAAYNDEYALLFSVTNKFETKISDELFTIELKGDRVVRNNIKNFAYSSTKTILKGNHIGSFIYFFDEDKKMINIQKSNPENLGSNFTKTLFLRFENPLSLILKDKLAIELFFSADEDSYFWNSNLDIQSGTNTFLNTIFQISYKNKSDQKDTNNITNQIQHEKWFSIDALCQNLKQFSPIKNIKIDWTLTRQSNLDEYDDAFTAILIQGIDFQFNVNNEWVNWTQLSDGTKRLFYLIGSVTYATKNEIILIEEPELGVHPHQLALLMNFLMSKSAHNQIIISTHSPQVLNSLGEDELDNIIVARHEGKEGTKMYHLSEEEKGYATEYMKNVGFLSDYWMMSGFMQEENPEFL